MNIHDLSLEVNPVANQVKLRPVWVKRVRVCSDDKTKTPTLSARKRFPIVDYSLHEVVLTFNESKVLFPRASFASSSQYDLCICCAAGLCSPWPVSRLRSCCSILSRPDTSKR